MTEHIPARRTTAADAVIFDDRGRVLLQRRADFGFWGLPGGAVEAGETLEQAVRREVKEKTGFDVEVVRLIGASGYAVCAVSLIALESTAAGRGRFTEQQPMAKAKKQDTPEKKPAGGSKASGGTKKAAPQGKPDAKARTPAKPEGAGAGAMPMIDTNLAAAAAANMLLSRSAGANAPATSGAEPAGRAGDAGDGDKRETSAFKQLKQSLGSQGLGNLLGGAQAGKKSNQSFGGGPQVRRNQTFGADVSRVNVPRRTGG